MTEVLSYNQPTFDGGLMADVSSETRFLHAIEIGLGAWQWGDRLVWQYGQGYSDKEVHDAFKLSVEEGIRFVDTAEAYGNGMSERLLGKFIKETDQPILIATKYFPFPWRFSRSSIPHALKNSLERIGVDSVDLYQIHWPTPLRSIDRMMDGMVECVKSGMTRTVGISNFNQTQMLTAYSALARQNIPLASNQVHYSLLNRKAEKNGLLARCKELGVRLIAYSPLEQGLLTGKYNADNRPPGTRGGRYANILPKIAPLIKLMTTIGQDHGGKSNAQVALNWTMCKGTLPIPGAKNVNQAQENAGALGWKLTEDEVVKLDEVSEQVLSD
jgi:aryl-alcohol dehydrogenase-like predicted oxidoreductase